MAAKAGARHTNEARPSPPADRVGVERSAPGMVAAPSPTAITIAIAGVTLDAGWFNTVCA